MWPKILLLIGIILVFQGFGQVITDNKAIELTDDEFNLIEVTILRRSNAKMSIELKWNQILKQLQQTPEYIKYQAVVVQERERLEKSDEWRNLQKLISESEKSFIDLCNMKEVDPVVYGLSPDLKKLVLRNLSKEGESKP